MEETTVILTFLVKHSIKELNLLKYLFIAELFYQVLHSLQLFLCFYPHLVYVILTLRHFQLVTSHIQRIQLNFAVVIQFGWLMISP